jgi:DNA-directed RNA polymerase I subunit RPA2
MERDALIAHGVAYCLNDRLLKCSDYTEGYICDKCGNLLSTYIKKEIISDP